MKGQGKSAHTAVCEVLTLDSSLVEKPHKFQLLDGIRGLAALAVGFFHYPQLSHPRMFPHGYLAVDIFFVLSGFVLASAYGQRLVSGLSLREFIKIRLIRLCPIYFLGVAVGFIYFTQVRRVPIPHGALGQVTLIVLALLFIPAPSTAAHPHAAFPFNPPTWSLSVELIANLVHGLALRRRSNRTLLCLSLLFGALLVRSILQSGSVNFGIETPSFLQAIIRVLYSYILGILIFRVWSRYRQVRMPALVPVAVVLALLATPHLDEYGTAFDLAATLIIIPATVAAASFTRLSSRTGEACELLGAMSYGFYVFHVPLGGLLLPYMVRARVPLNQQADLLLTAVALLTLMVDRYFDLPVRRLLRGMLLSKQQTSGNALGGSTSSRHPPAEQSS